MNQDEDYFIPITPPKGYQECIDDLKYIQDKLFAALRIPPEYLGYEPPVIMKCECGGDKCRTTHSDWCPKYGV